MVCGVVQVSGVKMILRILINLNYFGCLHLGVEVCTFGWFNSFPQIFLKFFHLWGIL